MKLKSHLMLDSKKRSGILLLVIILSACWIFYFWTIQKENSLESIDDIAIYQARIDSLKEIETLKSTPKIYPFNPNFITDYKGYTLGLSTKELDKLFSFRKNGKWINSSEDFQKVTGVSDSLLAAISPYFKFPDWVTNSKTSQNTKSFSFKSFKPQNDLNKATFENLISLPEMTEESARLILAYRKKIGGFIEDNQLYDIYNVKRNQVIEVKKEFTVKTKPDIVLINVNKANVSDLATVPFLTFDIARSIIDYRILNEGIKNLDELLKIEGITPYKLDRIKLYLSTSQ
ncbi:helix-hairpin-helix domain-containing protein [Leeuwenhoekiella sp. W20_SRS_FM14]|uniref:helix-hairpin-helix domain-containing protein n=1 Tax=Leeuwenhoekiella sp. W20_SRS_FM14 TaxID=3240270 RepID=UPI003F985E68